MSLAQVAPGAKELVRTQLYLYEPILAKLTAMHKHCLKRRSGDFDGTQVAQIEQAFADVAQKYRLVHLQLELLWDLRLYRSEQAPEAAQAGLSAIQLDETEQLLADSFLQGFLFQAKALADLLGVYICRVLGDPHPGYMSVGKLKGRLRSRADKGEQAALQLEALVQEHFGAGSWGDTLRSLRDKVAHLKALRPSHDCSEVILGVRLDFPTVRGEPYERFVVEHITGNLWQLIKETMCILSDLPWPDYPIRPGTRLGEDSEGAA